MKAILLLALAGCGSSRAVTGDGGHDTGTSDVATSDIVTSDVVTNDVMTNDAGDGGLGCAASGASCAASGCCADISDSCLAQGSDRLCLHAVPPPTNGPACNGAASSSLPGASLTFPDDRCSYTQAEAAAGITIRYQVEIAADLAGVHPSPTDAGRCEQPGASGLVVGFGIAGNGQSYCICDTGLCDQQTFTTAPRAGTYPTQIAWDGRNWSGPSDTGNPKGAPFPPGTYNLTLTARGSVDGAADGGAAYLVTAIRFLTIMP
jgi:hypothetical protein